MEIEKGSESLSFDDSNKLIKFRYENTNFKIGHDDQLTKNISKENKNEIYDITIKTESQVDFSRSLIIPSNSDQITNSGAEKSKNINKITSNSPKEMYTKCLENSITSNDQKKGLFSYQRDYSGTSSVDMFFRYNPGKTEKELADMLDSHETKQYIDPTIEDEEKAILKIISEFYSNKRDNYKICNCKYCKVLTLPFLLARNIDDSKKLEEIELKHKEYYTNCIQKLGISINQSLLIPVHNIFMKKVNLNQVRITSVFEQISKSNSVVQVEPHIL